MGNKNTEYNKRWRKKNPAKRNAARKRYYAKSQNAPNHKQRYTEDEVEMILKHEMPDSELAKRIGRSIQAIQGKRNKMIGR